MWRLAKSAEPNRSFEKITKTEEKDRPSRNTRTRWISRWNSSDETVKKKKSPHDLRFTVMADCIRIGNKAARGNGKPATRGAVRLNFFWPAFLEKQTRNYKMWRRQIEALSFAVRTPPRTDFSDAFKGFKSGSEARRSLCPLLQWLCADTKRRSHILHVSGWRRAAIRRS